MIHKQTIWICCGAQDWRLCHQPPWTFRTRKRINLFINKREPIKLFYCGFCFTLKPVPLGTDLWAGWCCCPLFGSSPIVHFYDDCPGNPVYVIGNVAALWHCIAASTGSGKGGHMRLFLAPYQGISSVVEAAVAPVIE